MFCWHYLGNLKYDLLNCTSYGTSYPLPPSPISPTIIDYPVLSPQRADKYLTQFIPNRIHGLRK